jgi:archaellum biogenesis ATPase FlaH
MRIETIVLSNLITNEDYCRKVLPFLTREYFHEDVEGTLFTIVKDHITEYNTLPSLEIVALTLNELPLAEHIHKMGMEYLKELSGIEKDSKWLLDKTEEFCQEKALHNAIMKSIQVLNGTDKQLTKGAIPQLLSDALGVSFDTHIGHDWLDDFAVRFDFYHLVEKRIAFDLEYFNLITNGGLPNKTLTCILAGTGVGKSLFMCHMAATNLMDGKKVLYITAEMAEERIAERIDANLLDVNIKDLENLDRATYEKKVEKIRDKTEGRLIIKEYPTATANVGHIRYLLNELKLKRKFIPDIIYIDYLNIMCSQRLKYGANVNSYLYIKSIAEELRGLAVEKDVPIVTATQTTRSGSTNSDPGLEDTSESFGLPATVDFMFAVISSEELASLNQLMVKQLKNRFNDLLSNRRFVVGVDRSKMRLYDVEQSAQDDVSYEDRPVMDTGSIGERIDSERKFDKTKFANFR